MWRKSSRSNGNAGTACVEIALNGSMARIRDSKNPAGATVAVPAWVTFLAAIKRDDFR